MPNLTKLIFCSSFIAIAALGLSACSSSTPDTQEGNGLEGDEADVGVDDNLIGGHEGVSSDGSIFPADTNAIAADGAESAFQGSGELAPETESRAETERLLSLPSITADGLSNKSIIGIDDRKLVSDTTSFPQRAQVLIALPGGRCSGVMVGQDLVLTAGHCVHSGGASGAWMKSATVYPGRNGANSPFGSCTAKRFYSIKGWTEKRNSNYDFGAIKLNCDIGNRVGWLGYFFQPNSLNGLPATISSYPGDKPLEQWAHSGTVKQSNGLKSYYDTDTMPGNSGSGVFGTTGVPAACKGPCVHTVHAYGTSSNVRFNSGTRISSALFDNVKRWKLAQ